MKEFISYLIIINVITFLFMGLDKKRAVQGKWRLSESFLLGLGILGGSIGGIAGIYTFRHKTKKKRFTIGYPVIIILHLILYFIYFR